MKGYIVTLANIPQSVEMGWRCFYSAHDVGVEAEIFPAVWKDIALEEAAKEGLKIGTFDEKYSNTPAVVGNFVSQYRIWNEVVRSNEPAIILEHDAVFTAPVPNYATQGDIVNIAKPSFGQYNEKTTAGIYPFFAKNGGYFAGAHGYYVSVKGAKQLIKKAKQIGIHPCDLFLNTKNFPELKEIWPWIVEAKDSFTTIQKVEGCIAKHNYDNAYEIL